MHWEEWKGQSKACDPFPGWFMHCGAWTAWQLMEIDSTGQHYWGSNPGHDVQTSQYSGEVFVSQQQIFLEVSAWRLISQELFNIFMGVLSENNFLTFALFFSLSLELKIQKPRYSLKGSKI